MKHLLISPHCDDESLFCWSILQKKPIVVIVCDGTTHLKFGVTPEDRRKETQKAMDKLGLEVKFLGFREKELISEELMYEFKKLKKKYKPDIVYAPALEGGNQDHDLVSTASSVFNYVEYYKTYTEKEITGKDRAPKLILDCYKSQIRINPQCYV
jgi:LmbE family N-acetylglucosaminyl deacetylase